MASDNCHALRLCRYEGHTWVSTDCALCPVQLGDLLIPASVFDGFDYMKSFQSAITTAFGRTSDAWLSGLVRVVPQDIEALSVMRYFFEFFVKN